MKSALLLTLACLILLAVGFHIGTWRTENRCLKAVATAAEQIARQTDSVDAQRLNVERQSIAAKSKLDTIQAAQTQEIIRYVQNPTGTSCDLDADGMRLWRSANASTLPDAEAAVAVPIGGLPRSTAAGGTGYSIAGGQSRPGGAALSPVQSPARGAISVRNG